MVVGASSGLGRCIAIGLAERGAQVAMLARRKDRLDRAVQEAGGAAFAVECDVTDEASCRSAIDTAASKLGGVDAFVYTPAIGPLVRLTDLDIETWRRAFDTNVIGASMATAAALPHLQEAAGRAVYLSSVSASHTPPWPGLGAYVVSKAALDKLVEAWRAEHPEVGFTRLVVGDAGGGEGESMTGFTDGWDPELAAELAPIWVERNLLSGALIDIDDFIGVVDSILRAGPTASLPSVIITPKTSVTPE